MKNFCVLAFVLIALVGIASSCKCKCACRDKLDLKLPDWNNITQMACFCSDKPEVTRTPTTTRIPSTTTSHHPTSTESSTVWYTMTSDGSSIEPTGPTVEPPTGQPTGEATEPPTGQPTEPPTVPPTEPPTEPPTTIVIVETTQPVSTVCSLYFLVDLSSATTAARLADWKQVMSNLVTEIVNSGKSVIFNTITFNNVVIANTNYGEDATAVLGAIAAMAVVGGATDFVPPLTEFRDNAPRDPGSWGLWMSHYFSKDKTTEDAKDAIGTEIKSIDILQLMVIFELDFDGTDIEDTHNEITRLSYNVALSAGGSDYSYVYGADNVSPWGTNYVQTMPANMAPLICSPVPD